MQSCMAWRIGTRCASSSSWRARKPWRAPRAGCGSITPRWAGGFSAFERELGAKLFERTPDGFVLTDAGESIRAAAEQMEQSAVAVEQRALGADRRLSGTVRVAAAESAGHAVVLPAMRELHLRHPEIRLYLMTGLARLDIARREADLALRFAPPESGDLRIRRLTPMGFALYASEDYLARHRPPAPGAGFAGHDAVLFQESIRGAAGMISARRGAPRNRRRARACRRCARTRSFRPRRTRRAGRDR